MQVAFLPNGAPECPLVRIFDFDCQQVCELKNMFTALANGDIPAISLANLPFVEMHDNVRLQLEVGRGSTGLFAGKEPNSFVWTLSTEDWKDVAGLTKPFCKANAFGFQWLNNKGISLLLSVDGTW